MGFDKLLGVIAALFVGCSFFLFIPPHFAKTLASTNDKYKELPTSVVTVATLISAVVYCLFKNTFVGFVASWVTLFLLFCFLITLLRFNLASKKYRKLTFTEKKRNIVIWLNVAVLIVAAVAVFAVDRKSSDFPKPEEIETIYYAFEPLKETDSKGLLTPEYAVIHPDEVYEMVIDATSEGIDETEHEALIANFKQVRGTIKSDEQSFSEVLARCKELNGNFFKQRFSKIFRTTDEVTENPFLYVVFRTKDGKVTAHKYEYGAIDISLATTDYYSDMAVADRLYEMQTRVEDPERQIKEIGVFFRSKGNPGEQLLAPTDYEFMLTAITEDEIPAAESSGEVSVGRMCVFIKDSHKMPPIYAAYGFVDREVTKFYNITNENENSWDYLTTLLEIEK